MTNLPPGIKSLAITIDDSPSTDILSHIDQCVDWIDGILRGERNEAQQARRRGSLHPVAAIRGDDDGDEDHTVGVLQGEKQVSVSPTTSPTTSPTKHHILRKGGVLIHCQAGMSRSATITAAYLMKVLGVGVDEALDMIRQVRPVIE